MNREEKVTKPNSVTDKSKHHFWMNIDRIQALTDGIFAISMTLLVLGLEVPRVSPDAAGDALRRMLSDDWPRFEDYALSFLLLGVFWVGHHRQFHFIKRTNETFLWINIIVLMFVAMIPFSTSVMASYDALQQAAVIFEVNLLVIGLGYLLMWTYATADSRLIDPADIGERRIQLVRSADPGRAGLFADRDRGFLYNSFMERGGLYAKSCGHHLRAPRGRPRTRARAFAVASGSQCRRPKDCLKLRLPQVCALSLAPVRRRRRGNRGR